MEPRVSGGLGSRIWNSLSEEIKAEAVCNSFKEHEPMLCQSLWN